MKRIALLSVCVIAACQPTVDPDAAAKQAAAVAREADAEAEQFELEYGRHNWELARAHGDVLLAKYPQSAAATRIQAHYADAKTMATEAREQRRLAALWAYQTEAVKGGEQRSAALYAKENVDTDGHGAHPVRLIFRDHPGWGRSSYLVLEAGDFNCYGGCRVKVTVDGGTTHSMAASRPKTDEAIAMFIEDERALWRLAQQAKPAIAIEFPVKAGGTRTAKFETAGLAPSHMPGWR